MTWVALSVAVAAIFAAGLAYREASQGSSAELKRTLTGALESHARDIRNLRQDWDDQLERITKQHRRNAAAARRLEQLMEEGELEEGEGEESSDVRGYDAQRGAGGGVLPLRSSMAGPSWRGGRTG